MLFTKPHEKIFLCCTFFSAFYMSLIVVPSFPCLNSRLTFSIKKERIKYQESSPIEVNGRHFYVFDLLNSEQDSLIYKYYCLMVEEDAVTEYPCAQTLMYCRCRKRIADEHFLK